MPGIGASLKFGAGSRGGPGGNSMYPGWSSGSSAPAHIITGELWFLLFAELVMLGVIRFTFLHHLGG